MIDSSKWSVIEAGPQARPGPAGRQLALAQGGRGGVPAPGAARPPLRRGRDRDGLRRAGPGGHGRAQGRDRQAGLRPADRAGGLRPDGRHRRPEHLRHRHGHRGARRLRRRLHRGDAAASRRSCPASLVSGGVSNVSFSFRGNDAGARGDPRRVPVPRDRARAWTWASSTPARCRSTTTSSPSCAERAEDLVLNRRADATERMLEIAERGARRRARRRGPARDLAWREAPVARAARARPDRGHRRLHRRGHGGGARWRPRTRSTSSRGR